MCREVAPWGRSIRTALERGRGLGRGREGVPPPKPTMPQHTTCAQTRCVIPAQQGSGGGGAPGPCAVVQRGVRASGRKKPNVVMIMADDVGYLESECVSPRHDGGSTPNIDRIAARVRYSPTTTASSRIRPGGPRSSPAGPLRTGLLKVGMPTANHGLQDSDPTIAELLKPLEYTSAQIAKNHLGDRNEYLPRSMASMSSTASSITSTRWKSLTTRNTRRWTGFYDRFGPRNILDTKATDVDRCDTDVTPERLLRGPAVDALLRRHCRFRSPAGSHSHKIRCVSTHRGVASER
jgi:hypothetical protein